MRPNFSSDRVEPRMSLANLGPRNPVYGLRITELLSFGEKPNPPLITGDYVSGERSGSQLAD